MGCHKLWQKLNVMNCTNEDTCVHQGILDAMLRLFRFLLKPLALSWLSNPLSGKVIAFGLQTTTTTTEQIKAKWTVRTFGYDDVVKLRTLLNITFIEKGRKAVILTYLMIKVPLFHIRISPPILLSLSLLYNLSHLVTKPTKWLCAQRRLRSAWASTQSDQSLRCPHEESFVP